MLQAVINRQQLRQPAMQLHKRNLNFCVLLAILFGVFLSTPLIANAQNVSNSGTEEKKIAVLRGLDKITGKVLAFSVPVGSGKNFGTLYIQVSSCKKSLPFEKPESMAFLKIWDSKVNEEPSEIFSGWMFASSPALSAMDHAVYDIWVYDCID